MVGYTVASQNNDMKARERQGMFFMGLAVLVCGLISLVWWMFTDSDTLPVRCWGGVSLGTIILGGCVSIYQLVKPN